MSDLKIIARLLLIFVCVGNSIPAAQAEDVRSILKTADAFRLPADSVQVKTRIRLYKNDKLDKERE
jgi:hypothetical protein